MRETDFTQLPQNSLEGIVALVTPEEKKKMGLVCHAYHRFIEEQRLPLPIMRELATHTLPESYHFYHDVYAISADHTLFAAVCTNTDADCRYLYLWNISTGECTNTALTPKTKDYYTQISFSISGNYLLLGTISTQHPCGWSDCSGVELWSITDGLEWSKILGMNHKNSLTAMIPLPQDRWILAYEDSKCEVIDLADSMKIFPPRETIAQTQRESCALSPDGQYLMLFGMEDNEMRLLGMPESLDANKLFEPKKFTPTCRIAGVNAVCFSEDNRLIAVGCLRENFIYLLNKDGILQQKIYFFAMPRHMFFLGSDKVVISSHYDSYLWDLNLRKMFKMTFPFTLMSLQSQTSQGKTTIIFPPNKNQITLYQMEHPKPALTNTTETDVTERPAKRLKL